MAQESIMSRQRVMAAWLGLGAGLLIAAVLSPASPSYAGLSLSLTGWLTLGIFVCPLPGSAATGCNRRTWARVVHNALGFGFLTLACLAPRAFPDINGAAGTLLLFVPVWIARAAAPAPFSTGAALIRLGYAGASLLAFHCWLDLGSRGGLFAALSAVLIWLWLAYPRLRSALRQHHRGMVVGGAGMALLVAWTCRQQVPRWIENLLLEEQLEGLSLRAVLSGRPAIWQRTIWAGADFPLGLGSGQFSDTVPRLYPLAASGGAHAHQGALQMLIDGGFLALICWFALWLAALIRSRHEAYQADVRQRFEAAGIAGALVGYGIFSLADCLPWSSLAAPAVAALLGLGLTANTQTDPIELRGRRALRAPVGITLLSLGIVALWMLPKQLANRHEARKILNQAPLPSTQDQRAASPWLKALATPSLTATERWLPVLQTQPGRLLLVAHQAPRQLSLARAAVELDAGDGQAWLWLGRAMAADFFTRHDSRHLPDDGPKDPPRSDLSPTVEAFYRGLQLRPRDSAGWLDLARLLRHTDRFEETLNALEAACIHGDPQAASCDPGGQLAEQLGQDQRALQLYRRSRLPISVLRAERVLERLGS